MSQDHLSQETSISAELTDKGLKAAAKSRAVASIDRLFGNISDIGNAWIEGLNARKRAKDEGERRLIEAAASYGLQRMHSDDEFANRAFENHYKKLAQQQLNRDAVATEALEDLRQTPPTDAEAISGPDTVSEEFFSRFETYAEGATTEQLRQRWGRVLAGEIRNPGTFSPKVLRATDELDAEAASLFENLMKYRVLGMLVECVMPEITFEQRLLLVSAGLIVDPGLTGHRHTFGEGEFQGDEVWLTFFQNLLVTFSKSVTIPSGGQTLVAAPDGRPSYGVFILTDVGKALSSILPSDEITLGWEYAKKLRAAVSPSPVKVWFQISPGQFVPLAFPA